MTFAQYIVFIEEMHESAVNDNAEDFPKVAVDTYPHGSYWGQMCLHFCGLGSFDRNIMEDTRTEDVVKELKYGQLDLWSVYLIISFIISGYHQHQRPFLGCRVCILSCSSFNIIGESSWF